MRYFVIIRSNFKGRSGNPVPPKQAEGHPAPERVGWGAPPTQPPRNPSPPHSQPLTHSEGLPQRNDHTDFPPTLTLPRGRLILNRPTVVKKVYALIFLRIHFFKYGRKHTKESMFQRFNFNHLSCDLTLLSN